MEHASKNLQSKRGCRSHSPYFSVPLFGIHWCCLAGRDKALDGRICTLDGRELPVRCMHKIIQDYVEALCAVGFEIKGLRELTVTEELAAKGDFFVPLKVSGGWIGGWMGKACRAAAPCVQ
jgi:hypothetical protein